MFTHTISIKEGVTIYGEWATEEDFRASKSPTRQWDDAPPDILAEMNAAFQTALPPEVRPMFAAPYAIVRVLVQAEQYDLARASIAGIEVPPELEEAKAHLLTLIPETP